MAKLEKKLGKKFHSILISKKENYKHDKINETTLGEKLLKKFENEGIKEIRFDSNPEIDGQWVDFVANNADMLIITVLFSDVTNGYQRNEPYSIGSMSSGEKMMINYISFLSRSLGKRSKGIIFLFDEPETSLHPKWQLEFPETLRQLAEEVYGITGSHFIIATHSPLIVMRSGYIPNSQVIKLYRDDEHVLHSDIIKELNQFNLLNLLFSEFGFDYYPTAEHESALKVLQEEKTERVGNENQLESVKKSAELMRNIHAMYEKIKSSQE